MANVTDQVGNYIKHLNHGAVFTFKDVLEHLGTPPKDTVCHALRKLVLNNTIIHVKKGVYLRPQRSSFGLIPVDPWKVVKAAAKDINATVYPSGAGALNALGLSTQLAMSQSYIASKRIAPFTVNDSSVKIRYSRSISHLEAGTRGLTKDEREKVILLWLSLEYLGEREAIQMREALQNIITSLSPKAIIQIRSTLRGSMKWAVVFVPSEDPR